MRYEWRFPFDANLIVYARSLGMKWDAVDKCWWSEDPSVGSAIIAGNHAVIALAQQRNSPERLEMMRYKQKKINPWNNTTKPSKHSGICKCS